VNKQQKQNNRRRRKARWIKIIERI